MAGTCGGVIKAHLAYVIRKAIVSQVSGDYPKYLTSDNKMIVRMLPLPPDNNKLHNEQGYSQ